MGNKNENIHLFILEKMRKGSLLESETKSIFPNTIEQLTETSPNDTSPKSNITLNFQEPISILKERKKEEEILLNKKNELSRNIEILRLRIAEKIETRKRRIERYQTEIYDLKKECPNLQIVITN